jgi:hypothetical protein
VGGSFRHFFDLALHQVVNLRQITKTVRTTSQRDPRAEHVFFYTFFTQRHTVIRSCSIVAVIACSATVSFAAQSWTQPAGMSDNITYSNGQTQNGLLEGGTPTVGPDAFVFTPNGFVASESGNTSVSDLLSVTINAKAGKQIDRISTDLGGDYSFLDGSGNGAYSLKITNLDTNAMLTDAQLFSAFTGDQGTFSGIAAIDLPDMWRNVLVELSANVGVTTQQAGAAAVELKVASLSINTEVAAVPLPPAALAAIPGIAVAYFARRKMRRA